MNTKHELTVYELNLIVSALEEVDHNRDFNLDDKSKAKELAGRLLIEAMEQTPDQNQMKSIIHTENTECCYICGQWATDTHHCIHGTANRKLADKDGLTVRLCRRCHMNLHDKGNLDKELQRIAQARWMEYYRKSEDEFRERYGKSYI